ncbi:MAG: preprotein translocase subunit YajC [Bdellovibrionaceae bacterium]|nr:preprotein translocase subunit YajC [Pseudobdellovibrionaceae bacterium]
MNYIAELIFPLAHAQAASGQSPNLLMQLFPIIAMVFIFYFLMIRPQMKNQKIKQQFLSQLKRGDEVLTSSGIFGTIEGLTEKFITLEISDGVKIRILRDRVMAPAKEPSKEVKND